MTLRQQQDQSKVKKTSLAEVEQVATWSTCDLEHSNACVVAMKFGDWKRPLKLGKPGKPRISGQIRLSSLLS